VPCPNGVSRNGCRSACSLPRNHLHSHDAVVFFLDKPMKPNHNAVMGGGGNEEPNTG
jgi:hypothetical protein